MAKRLSVAALPIGIISRWQGGVHGCDQRMWNWVHLPLSENDVFGYTVSIRYGHSIAVKTRTDPAAD